VTVFHLDEYIRISEFHPASFRKYLKERLANIVWPKEFIYVNGNADPGEECDRLKKLIGSHPVDVAFVGIGENSHLAFNDPPADFETDEAYLEVSLDEACRLQQLNEGWFAALEDVPKKAITMSVRQIMKARTIICCVPGSKKGRCCKKNREGMISPSIPASIMRQHEAVWLFLDPDSASLLTKE